MKELLISLFGMAVTGLAFIVYKHPKIGKRIIEIVASLYCISFALYAFNNRGIITGMSNSMEVVSDMSRQTAIFKTLFDNRYKAILSDSVSEAAKLNQVATVEVALQMHKMMIMDSIVNKIEAKRGEIINNRDNYGWLFLIGLLVLVTLYYFSNIFNNKRQPYSKKHNDSPDQASN